MSYEGKCDQMRELLSAMVDDELDGAARKLVAAHLLTCTECSGDLGRMLAAKSLVRRDATEAAAPAGFMRRLHNRLDEASEVRQRVRHHPPARRMTGIAAVGAIAVSIAIIFSTVFYMRGDNALQLAEMHQQLSIGAPLVTHASDYALISRDAGRDSWHQLRQAVLRVDGMPVTYSLYRVGNSLVSVFEGPYAWEPYRTGRSVTERIGGFDVRQVGDQSMVTWQHSAHRYVLTSNAPAETAAALAHAFQRAQGRSSGL